MARFTRSFSELTPKEQVYAGGKGGSLAKLVQAGYPVPDGFVILPAAFDQDGRELQGQDGVEEGEVLRDELFLEADGMRGNHHPTKGCLLGFPPCGGEDGGHEVGEALSDAGARLDDQVMLPVDGSIDGLGHGELLGPMFIVRHPGGDPPFRAQDFGRRGHQGVIRKGRGGSLGSLRIGAC
jgi:hypothetical protein